MPTLADYGAPYPKAAPDEERKVIYLPPLDPSMEQNHVKLQLIPGRHEDCKDGQLYHINGTFTENTLEGWGYPFYAVKFGDICASQHAAVSSKGGVRFVTMREYLMVPYNSKLPTVVYVPKGSELRYRVWMDDYCRIVEAAAASKRAGTKAASKNHHNGTNGKEHTEAVAHRGVQQLNEYEQVHEARRLRSVEAGGNQRESLGDAKGVVERQRGKQEAEAQSDDRREQRKSNPNSEHRHRSSSKHRKHTSSDADAPAQDRQRNPSAPDEASAGRSKISSVDKGHTGSSSSDRRGSSPGKHKDKEDPYEKKAKNFWSRARGSSKSKDSTSKRSNSKTDQWSEM
ncbi:putative ecotin [Leptomonas seymouri]|uniref:Putative ecotin n=1 Tax=Leptomonas seymouri TaxID=5684 RepID=A0A0N1HZ51_LEPSE|nr:putative ecotin [Leptomonas seymouri]|eukprot:KPI88381.1 putative ecotin [Leptomonas seymouri]